MTNSQQDLATWFSYLTTAFEIAGVLTSQTAGTLSAFGSQTGAILPGSDLAQFIFQFQTKTNLPGVSASQLTSTTTFVAFIGKVAGLPKYPVLAVMADAAQDSSALDVFSAKQTSVVFADPAKQSGLLAVIHDPSIYPSGYISATTVANLIAQFTDATKHISDTAALITPA